MNNRQWVVNASPLIVLCKVNSESLIEQLTDSLLVPEAVIDEIKAGPVTDRARQLATAKYWSIVDVSPISPALLAWDLGAGETAVIEFGMQNPGYTAVLDDGAARRCSRSFDVPLIGTLGVILLARQEGLIPSAAKLLRELRNHQFRLDDAIIAKALKETVGEIW